MKAQDFEKELKEYAGERPEKDVLKFFHGNDGETRALGIKFGTVFKLAKKYTDLPLADIDDLLDSKFYEIRMGAVSIMDYQAKSQKVPQASKKALFNLYLHRHDRLNNWDFVDRGAPSIVGNYILDKPRDILYELAISENVWKRRTAIVATHAFIKKGELDDTFNIAEILIHDDRELIQKAVGSWIREAGKKDEQKLKAFLDKHAVDMPGITLRYATEKLDRASITYYLNLRK